MYSTDQAETDEAKWTSRSALWVFFPRHRDLEVNRTEHPTPNWSDTHYIEDLFHSREVRTSLRCLNTARDATPPLENTLPQLLDTYFTKHTIEEIYNLRTCEQSALPFV
ncbi:hypothetical protein BaRGS_00020224 [Batillaria attramentaria]|uniref:Uncharacterized protein n=1 Tax=Batillaria attramentaria TaxID=370345 RepID=A0ABD0KNW9_9CAEN